MASNVDFLADLSLSKDDSHVVVRVNRLWTVKSADNPFYVTSIEIILMDAKGEKIHASARNKMVKRFERLLKEGSVYSLKRFALAENGGEYRTTKHQYKMTFQYETKVKLMPQNTILAEPFTYVPFPEIIAGLHDPIYLIDVIALLTGFGDEREVDTNGKISKRRVVELENSGIKINCTLWGPYVDQLNTFLGAGDTINTVVVIYGAKIREFGRKTILQNAFGSTGMEFNPVSVAALEFRNSILDTNPTVSQSLSLIDESSLPSLLDDFLTLNPKKTIAELKDAVVEKDSCFIVMGTIKHLIDSYDWWYTSCKCQKAVQPDLIAYYCASCKKRIVNVKTRFRIRVKVLDDTDSTTFVIFDRVASLLLGKTCEEMLEKYDEVDSAVNCPSEISNLVDKKFLFKVEVKADSDPKYASSFTVKRMTADEDVMTKFMSSNFQPDNLTPGMSVNMIKHSVRGEGSNPVEPQDLMSQFSSAASEEAEGEVEAYCHNLAEDADSQDGGKGKGVAAYVGCVDLGDAGVAEPCYLTPAKRDSDSVSGSAGGSSSPKLLKAVKIEKLD